MITSITAKLSIGEFNRPPPTSAYVEKPPRGPAMCDLNRQRHAGLRFKGGFPGADALIYLSRRSQALRTVDLTGEPWWPEKGDSSGLRGYRLISLSCFSSDCYERGEFPCPVARGVRRNSRVRGVVSRCNTFFSSGTTLNSLKRMAILGES